MANETFSKPDDPAMDEVCNEFFQQALKAMSFRIAVASRRGHIDLHNAGSSYQPIKTVSNSIRVKRFFPILLIVLLASTKCFAEILPAAAEHAILGEARGENFDGKTAIGEALRNRERLPYYKKKGVFHGVNGYQAHDFVVMPWTAYDAERAWKRSVKTNLTKGAQYWFSDSDLKIVNRAKWFKKLKFTKRVGNHYFYRE